MNTCFEKRGYIEGFYGRPWTAAQRLGMLRFMAKNGANTYYYAPKDDPYHRKLWRADYPEDRKAGLKEAVDTAAGLGMEFHYCIAPGLSMRYSSQEDFAALCAKTASLFALGIRGFGLLLDDIPEKLFYEEDRREYKDIAEAHSALCRRYYDFLKKLSPDCHLTVCPLQYCGKGTEDYITRFGKSLPAEVSVFFTGPDICSRELTSRDAQVFYNATGHKPLYWDNFPVNDAEMFKELHLAPLTGRDSDLHLYAEGIISNCMEYFECNKFPLMTAAAYMNDPAGYDPETAFDAALTELLPEDLREPFRLFADNLRTSCLRDENSRIMGQYLGSAAMLRETGQPEKALETVREYTEKVRASAELLTAQTSELFTELREWLGKYALMSEILGIALDVLEGRGGKKLLEEKMNAYNDRATVLTAFCFREYIESILENGWEENA